MRRGQLSKPVKQQRLSRACAAAEAEAAEEMAMNMRCPGRPPKLSKLSGE